MKSLWSFPIGSMNLNILLFLQETLPNRSTWKEWVLELFAMSGNHSHYCAVLIIAGVAAAQLPGTEIPLLVERPTKFVGNNTAHKNVIHGLTLL